MSDPVAQALSADAVRALRRELDPRYLGESGAAPPRRRLAAPSTTAWIKRRLQAVIERAIAWYVRPEAERAAREAAEAVRARLMAELGASGGADPRTVAVSLELLRAEVAALQRRVEELGAADARPARARTRRASAKPAAPDRA